MYDNIGCKIKKLAEIAFYFETVASVIAGIAMWIVTEQTICALIVVVGPLFAWISSALLYGFGEIVDKVGKIENNTRTLVKISSPKKTKPETAGVE